jgi:beta-lactamase superfamily II metal-dependent hydrolase
MQGRGWYEIDVLTVGQGERSGDAIAIRYSFGGGQWSVMVVDGGDKDAGARLVEHIRTHYGTNIVNHVVNTHPDSDHCSGLSVVLEEMDVKQLWMHLPWSHAPRMMDAFDDARLTQGSVQRRTADAVRAAKTLHDIAVRKRVPVTEPYQGADIGGFRVMSPSMADYLSLLPHFRCTPPAAVSLGARLVGANALAGLPSGVRQAIPSRLSNALASTAATPENEFTRLGTKPTAAENESSVVLFADFDGQRVLLTGDAGPQALTAAADYAARLGTSLLDLRLLQVPHHGSRNNLTRSVLDRISAKTAFVSVAAGSKTHPRPSVTNALSRRGTSVYRTTGSGLRFELNVGDRPGWNATIPKIPMYEVIEEP